MGDNELSGPCVATYMGKWLSELQTHLSKYDLYPTLSTLASNDLMKPMMNLIAYCDGKHSLLDIAKITGMPIWELVPIYKELEKNKLLVDQREFS